VVCCLLPVACLRSAVVSVAPPQILSPVETLRFRLTDVAGRTEVRGQSIFLPSQLAHGYHWALKIHVRGSNSSSTNRENLSIFLHLADPDVTVETEYAIKTAFKTTQAVRYTFSTCTKLEDPLNCFGWTDLIAREALLNADPSVLLQQDGSLTIDVDLRVYQTKPVWYPKCDDNLIKSLMVMRPSSYATTVTFMVGDEAFCLYPHFLADRAPALYKMIGATGQTVHLTDDVDACMFQSIVHYVYSGVWLSSSSDEAIDAGVAKKTLTLADRYACTGLKLLVESVMVDKVLEASNAMEMLLLGDSLNCAVLKEAAIIQILHSKDTVGSLPGWELLVQSNSLMEQLLNKARGTQSDETDATAKLSVGELRDQLLTHSGAAAVDGSREVLVQRLLLAITAATATAAVVA
jgi:BTB/POZ domain